MTAVKPRAERVLWLDVLRIAAAFLVIVNHTNSDLFQSLPPTDGTWWLSILWYYVSKLAVPLFVMVSGACLLNRVDSYVRTAQRALRVLAAMALFAYGYFLYEAWVYYGLFPRALRLDIVLARMWTQEVTDAFWYLYFYLGLLVALPFLQRMRKAMDRRDCLILVAGCFLISAAFPLLSHYVPALALPTYFDVPLMASGYIGLFFAGDLLRDLKAPSRRGVCLFALGLIASLATSVLLTFLEYGRVGAGAKYWFMDDRMHPALPNIAAAICFAALVKSACKSRQSRVITELGGCAFAIYLMQDLVIAQSEARLFVPLSGAMPAFIAMLCWEIAVFAACLLAAWLLRRIPILRRIL